jgi:hypothetical protein
VVAHGRLKTLLPRDPGRRRTGNPEAVRAAVIGYKAPAKVELTGKQGGPLAIETFRRMCEEAEREQAEAEESDDATTK